MTPKKGKSSNKSKFKPKRLSNPESTGGAGTAFESRVQATRLLAMCLGSHVPGVQDGSIVELNFQARIHGHHTDDLVCHIELPDGQRFRTLLQMKRTLTARQSDTAFSESIGAAWLDYNSRVFIREKDSIFLICNTASANSMKGAIKVFEWAQYCATTEEFITKVESKGFSNQANRSALISIRKIVELYAQRKIDNHELFKFIKHLRCLTHDLEHDGTVEHSAYLNSIKQAAAFVGEQLNPKDIWSTLVNVCLTTNGVAGTITFDNLENIIGNRLNGIFSGARALNKSPHSVGTSTKLTDSVTNSTKALTKELSRLSGLVESIKNNGLQASAQDLVPSSRDDSINKLLSRQLDGIHARVKEFRYRDAYEELSRFDDSYSQFDSHQQARWHLLRGTCKWHLESAESAAEDFILASKLCRDEDKFIAAGIRGVLLKGDAATAAKMGAEQLKAYPKSLAIWQVTTNARIALGERLSEEEIPVTLREEADVLQMLAWNQHQLGDREGAAKVSIRALDAKTPSFFTRDTALALCLNRAAHDGLSAAFRLFDDEERSDLKRCITELSPREEKIWKIQSPESVAITAANLATAHLILGEPEVALAVLQEAVAHGVSSPEFLRIELEAMADTGNQVGAITKGLAQIERMPKGALASFAQIAGDANELEALEAALNAAQNLEPPEPSLVQC